MNDSHLEVIDGVRAKPCVGCGYCCKKARCAASFEADGKHYADPFEAIGESKECPYLYWNGERYRCRLATKMAEELGIGLGCCMPLNTERKKYVEQDGTTS